MAHSKSSIKRGGLLAIMAWTAVAIFYFYECLVRVMPSVMLDDLRSFYNVNSEQLSQALASYYLIYGPIQLVVGLLFDKLGARKLLIPATFIVAASCLLVGLGFEGVSNLALGRFLMGLGSAFGWVGVVYIATVWHHPSKVAFLAGLATALGMFGAITGEAFLAHIAQFLGWMDSFRWTGYIGLALTAFMFWAIPTPPPWESQERLGHEEELGGVHFIKLLKIVLSNPQTWIIGLIGCTLYLPLMVFGDLWGIEYIKKITGVKATLAANSVSVFFLGWLIGAPISGWLSDKVKSRKKPLVWTICLSFVFLLILFLLKDLSYQSLTIFLFIIGLLTSMEITIFVACVEANPHYCKGTAIAAANMIVAVGGGIFQAVVGKILRVCADKNLDKGLFEFACNSTNDYQLAMLVLPLMLILGLILCFFMKETYGHQK